MLKKIRQKIPILSHVTAGSAARYALLPGFIPRMNRIISHIGMIFFSFVKILGSIGLIDQNHPCMKPQNIGRYPFSQILLLAWQNLSFRRENIGQILMFFSVCLTLLLISAMLFIFVIKILFYINSSHAQFFYFQAPNPIDIGMPYDKNSDWTFIFLERIFGNTGFFDFWAEQGANPAAVPANTLFTALFNGMLQTYSAALFGLAVFIILYVLIMAIVDAAKTGKPFGGKFDAVNAPIRMVITLFLLAPLPGSNYNAAQLLVFQTSEWGTNLANNIWLRSIHGMVEADSNETQPANMKRNTSFINVSNIDNGHRFIRDVFLIHLCMKGYNLINCQTNAPEVPVTGRVNSDPIYTSYQFGTSEAQAYCGKVMYSAPYIVPEGAPGNNPTGTPPSTEVTDFWPNRVVQGYEEAVANVVAADHPMADVADRMVAAYSRDTDADFGAIAGPTDIKRWIDDYRTVAFGLGPDGTSFGAYTAQKRAYNVWIVSSLEDDAERGWATAGVFYLRMSAAMSMASKVVEKPPTVKQYPINFTHMYATPKDPNVSNKRGYEMCLMKDLLADSTMCDSKSIPQRLYALLDKGNEWFVTEPIKNPTIYSQLGATAFSNEMRVAQKEKSEESMDSQSLFPSITSSLRDMAKFSAYDLHPLGTVISWGQTFMHTAFKAYTIAIAASIVLGAIQVLFGMVVSLGSPVSTIAIAIGNLFLLPGFVLAFVIPFIPAFYFMFAVLEWIISIVEAVIAMPLWALSFLTSQGDVLGEGLNGVKLLFEIILRPVIIVASLVFAVIIFTAGVTFINDAYALYMGAYDESTKQSAGWVVSAFTGFGAALIYMFLIYSFATSSFKLIDILPDKFGRWLNLPQGLNSINRDQSDDVKEKLVQLVIIKELFNRVTGFVVSVKSKMR